MNTLQRDVLAVTDAMRTATADLARADTQLRVLQHRTPINWFAVAGAHRERMRAWHGFASAAERAGWPAVLLKAFKLAAFGDALSADKAVPR